MASTSNSQKSKRPKKNDASEWSNDSASGDPRSSRKNSAGGKRMKTDESGIDNRVESNSSSSDDSSNAAEDSSKKGSSKGNQSRQDKDEPPQTSQAASDNPKPSSSLDVTSADAESSLDMSSVKAEAEMLDSSDEEDVDEDGENLTKTDIKKYDPTPVGPKPVHNWSAPLAFAKREYGCSSKYSPHLFRSKCYGSLHMVERLELMYKMQKHDGCVNALNFNSTGSKLVSGSDDLNVIIWDWTIAEPILEYGSGHSTNVFQTKFLPFHDDTFIVTCARDGQVRLGELSSDGSCRGTKKVVQHKGSVHKLSLQNESPFLFMTCGTDAVVFSIDLREEKPSKVLNCKHNEKKIPLYTICTHPQKSHEFAVAGRSQFVKIYDSRYLSQSDDALKHFCPNHLNFEKYNVTSVVYNYNGTELLTSYNDEDIYMFDPQETEPTTYLHRYKGHRNNQTVKGVNFFGSHSEFIVSGSDCGNIFFWEKETQHIVKYMYGDEGGAVNCLEPHPHMPVLATSGLDDDIKIWVPSCEEPPDLSGLQNRLARNLKGRDEENRINYPEAFVDQTIWFLMQHLSRDRPRGFAPAADDSDTSSTSSDEISASQCSQS